MVVIAALELVVEVDDLLHGKYPAPGRRHHVAFARSPACSFSITMPQRWVPRQLRPPRRDSRVERISFEAGRAFLPLVLVEVQQIAEFDSRPSTESDLLPKQTLLAVGESSQRYFDPQRGLIWARNRKGTIRVEYSRQAETLLIQFVPGTTLPSFEDADVVKVVDSLKFEEQPFDLPNEVVTTAPTSASGEKPEFMMGTGMERQEARLARLSALLIGEGIFACIAVIYVLLYRQESNQRIRETNRIMRAIRSGLSFSKATTTDVVSQEGRKRK
jgi:hypothetical protein